MLNKIRKVTLKKTFITILFLAISSGEILYSFYSNEQRGVESIKKQRDAEIEKFFKSKEAVDRYESMQIDIKQLDASTDAKQQQNESALEKNNGKVVINVFDDKIRADKKTKQGIIDKYYDWKNSKTEEIKADYQPRINSASGLSSNLYLSVTVSLMAIGLAFFSTQQEGSWRTALLLASFVAQCYVAKVIFDGTVIRNGSIIDGLFSAGVFFLCVPLSYHFGIICFNTNIAMSGITISQTKHGTSVTVWSRDVEGWKKAIFALANERARNNGKGMIADIARNFNVNKGQVHRAWKLVAEGKPLYVPKKLLETNETEN